MSERRSVEEMETEHAQLDAEVAQRLYAEDCLSDRSMAVALS
jgi:hypothetical protein